MLDTVMHTVAMRPYVFTFLAAFLVIGTLNRGAARTLLLLGVGYGVAYASEWISIRYGFPYGLYVYFPDALEGELILDGVPLWTSLSYPFLAYAGYETATVLGWRFPILGGAFLMTWADVVIDPISLQGGRWFLGRIYHYPEGGLYFGVPLSNFAGWFLVGLAILGVWDLLARRLVRGAPPLRAPWLGPAFYYGILTFIVVIGCAIGAWGAVGAGLLLHAPLIAMLLRRRRDAARRVPRPPLRT